MRIAPLAVVVLLLGAADPNTGSVIARVDGLRSVKGVVRACLTRQPSAFPDCRRDPLARRITFPATAQARAIRFDGLAPGRYAIALLHDENGNGRADMALMLPREGFGFSRNPGVRLGPPRFARAAFGVADEPVTQTIHMRYIF